MYLAEKAEVNCKNLTKRIKMFKSDVYIDFRYKQMNTFNSSLS